jgi:hypothetical protein
MVFDEIAAARQVQLRDRISVGGQKHLESVDDVTVGAWLCQLLPTLSWEWCVCVLIVVMMGLCPAAMQDMPLTCEYEKPFSPGQAMRCCADVRAVCHDISVDLGRRECVEKSVQASTRETADAHLQGDGRLDLSLFNGKRVDILVFLLYFFKYCRC